MPEALRGILCIGDPHICSWAPGYRKDDYTKAIFAKLRWALDYARTESLLPILLGDLFHVPRENHNALIVQLMSLLNPPVYAVVGNHDRSETLLSEHDSLAVLVSAGRVRRLSDQVEVFDIGGVRVGIGGTDHGQPFPDAIDREKLGVPRWVIWITHHDLPFVVAPPAAAPARGEVAKSWGWAQSLKVRPTLSDMVRPELAGVDLVVNGHVHAQAADTVRGSTIWCNPGSIARVSRAQDVKNHVPGVLRVDVSDAQMTRTHIEVPHRPFDEIFHPIDESPRYERGESGFITSLQSMQKFKTADGQGLCRLIESNLDRFSNERVKIEIQKLLQEVLPHAELSPTPADDRAAPQTV